MQFSEDELKALHAILEFAEPLIGATVHDKNALTSEVVLDNDPPSEVGLDYVTFLTTKRAEVLYVHRYIRELVDPNGLKALKVKARDMLAQNEPLAVDE